MNNIKIINKFYLLTLLIFIFFIFSAFENTYIILKNNYEIRLLKYAEYCEKQGYGFVKKILNIFPDLNPNLQIHNNSDFPSPGGYFYDFRKANNYDYLILLNFEKKDFIKIEQKNYIKIYQEGKCYLLKKND
jgi:hypothetical protein